MYCSGYIKYINFQNHYCALKWNNNSKVVEHECTYTIKKFGVGNFFVFEISILMQGCFVLS